MSRFLRSVHWRRHGLTALRLALQGIAWLLTHGGRLLESGGETLSALADMARAKPLRP